MGKNAAKFKVEEPKVEAPKVEAPKVEEPKVEAKAPVLLPASNAMEHLQNNIITDFLADKKDVKYEVSSGSVAQEIKRQTRLVALIFKNFEAFSTAEKMKKFVVFISTAKITVAANGEKTKKSTLVDLL